MMDILFFNDTRVEINPGCHATVNKLSSFIKQNVKDSEITFFPLGFEYELFSRVKTKRSIFYKVINLSSIVLAKFKLKNPIKTKTSSLDLKLWKQISLNELSASVKYRIDGCDLVVINMEGTIHHNSIGGLTLMGIANYAINKKKKIALVNGSYQAMDDRITSRILKNVDFISVREMKSLKYLQERNIAVSLIPDFAFLADINKGFSSDHKLNFKDSFEKKCLYTAGVLGVYPTQKYGIELDTIITQISDLRNLGYEPYYLEIEENEKFISEALTQLGVNIISYDDGMTYENVGTILGQFDLTISGRYHIGIFSLMKGIPTFFLKSNTFKIEGLLEMLNISNLIVHNNKISDLNIDKSFNQKYILPEVKDYLDFKVFLNKLNS
jgi:polysaccharide pyruvyl transferase WcaK-like protein